MNPVSGLVSYSSNCYQCRNIIFDQDLDNDIEIRFGRLEGFIHLLCQWCIDGILGNENWGLQCRICGDWFCICTESDFWFYRINLFAVLRRTQDIILLENQIWDEITYFHRRYMVRATARVSQNFLFISVFNILLVFRGPLFCFYSTAWKPRRREWK